MTLFDTAMKRVAQMEGGYVNDALDRGGETNHGITIAVARAFGYHGAMRDLTKAEALAIYRARYWTQPGFDRIEPISPEVAAWLLDFGINGGQAAAGAILQRALNVLNDRGAIYPDLTVDGACGAMTRAALAALLAKRGAEGRAILPKLLTALQAARYVEIMERDGTQERFGWGWMRRAFA